MKQNKFRLVFNLILLLHLILWGLLPFQYGFLYLGRIWFLDWLLGTTQWYSVNTKELWYAIIPLAVLSVEWLMASTPFYHRHSTKKKYAAPFILGITALTTAVIYSGANLLLTGIYTEVPDNVGLAYLTSLWPVTCGILCAGIGIAGHYLLLHFRSKKIAAMA